MNLSVSLPLDSSSIRGAFGKKISFLRNKLSLLEDETECQGLSCQERCHPAKRR